TSAHDPSNRRRRKQHCRQAKRARSRGTWCPTLAEGREALPADHEAQKSILEESLLMPLGFLHKTLPLRVASPIAHRQPARRPTCSSASRDRKWIEPDGRDAWKT